VYDKILYRRLKMNDLKTLTDKIKTNNEIFDFDFDPDFTK
jgi:hypothetical protein